MFYLRNAINDCKGSGLKTVNILLIIGTILYYRILWDVFILILLLVSAYCYGSLLWKKGKQKTVKLAIGLGFLGVLINLSLLLKVGTRDLMLIIVLFAIVAAHKELTEMVKKIFEKVCCVQISWWSILLTVIVLFLLVMGSAPIDAREGDALAKHLPVTVYAASDGAWNFNVSEGVIYGESMLLTYTYWTFFYSMQAYKAITIFNTILFCLTFVMVCEISKNIYSHTNYVLLGAIYFSAPLFFDLGTMMGTDMLSVYFLVSAVTIISGMSTEEIWNRTYGIAFLCACSLFSKLTVVNNVLLVVLITIISDTVYAVKEKNIEKLFVRIFTAVFLGCAILLPNIIVVWAKIGNPFLPAYNGIFHSPYAPLSNFEDPYANAPFSFSLKTLHDLVFNTSRNRIEGLNRDLGLFPFGIFLIPIAVFLRRKKEFVLACILPFISIVIGCLFTYNLRYLAATFLFFMIIITVSFSVITDNILKNKFGVWVLYSVFICVLFLFNICTFKTLKPYLIQSLKVNENITDFFMTDILKEIPTGKRVMMVDAIPYKSDYRGYFVSNNWYISYILEKIDAGELSWEEYVNCFDYILDSSAHSNTTEELDVLVRNAGMEGDLLEPYAMDDYMTCYKVNHNNATNKRLLYDEQNANAVGYIDGTIENLGAEDSCLFVNCKVDNWGEEAVIAVKVAWIDNDNKLLDFNSQFFRSINGVTEYESFVFERAPNAEKVSVVLEPLNQSDKETCRFEMLQMQTYTDFITEETKKLDQDVKEQ